MATKEEIRQYKEKQLKCAKNAKAHKVLNVLTGVIGILWPVAIAAIVLAWTFTTFLHTSSMQNVFKILTCLGICVGCATLVAMGIICPVQAYWGIDWNSSIALGVCLIIFAGVVPGVLFLVTMHLDKASKFYDQDPVERDEEIKEKERKAKDPRRFFTQDDDDVGEIPDINKLDFDDLKAALDAEEESEKRQASKKQP